MDRKQQKIINLYNDDSVYSVKHVISIADEEDLNQFWHYVSSSKESNHKLLHTFMKRFYNFALSYTEEIDSKFFEIILEENDHYFYFTLWNEEVSEIFENYIKKTSIEYQKDGGRISLKLVKECYESKLKEFAQRTEDRHKKLIASVSEEIKLKKLVCLEPYRFIEQEDLSELTKLVEDLQEQVYQAKKYGASDALFISFRSTLSLFCLTLRYYDEIAHIANTLTEFSGVINTNKVRFMASSEEEIELILGLVNNLENWVETTFIKGGADLHFMDNSIKADCDMIMSIMAPPSYREEEEFDLDAIFNF